MPKDERTGPAQITVRLPAELISQIDEIAKERCKGGSETSRQSLAAYWISQGVKDAKRAR